MLASGVPLTLAAAENGQEATKDIHHMQQLINNGEYRLAIPAGEACTEAAKKTGGNQIDQFRCMYHLAEAYGQSGAHVKAIATLKNCLAIINKHADKTLSFGFEHHLFISLANNYDKIGDQTNAESYLKQSVATIEKRFGKDSPDIVPPLTHLGMLYFDRHEYTKSLSALNRCIENIQTNKDRHKLEPSILQHMANVKVKIGEYAQAEKLYQRSLEIIEKRFGSESPATILARAALGELYVRTGEYAKAKSTCGRALELAETTTAPENAERVHSLSCLGDLYQTIGDFTKAEQLYKQAVDATGDASPEFAFTLQRLAQIYYLTGAYAQAIVLYEQALALLERTLGKEHPSLTPTLHDLGLCRWRTGDHAKAMALLERAVQIADKDLGKNSPDVIAPLNSLSRLHTYTGNVKTAEPLARRAIEVAEQIFGKEHHELVDKLYSLALIKHAQNDSAAAWKILLRLNAIDGQLIREVFGFTSEKQKMAYLARAKRYVNLSLRVLTPLASNQPMVRDGFNLWLKRKGLVLESQKQFQDALFHTDDPHVSEIFKKLAAVRTELSNLLFTDPDPEGQEAYRQKIATLERLKERLEGELSAHSQIFAVHAKKEKVDAIQIAKALPPKAALVDFARIDAAQIDYDRIGSANKKEPAARYLAFVVSAGPSGQVALVDLGDAEPIEQKLADLKTALDGRVAQPGTAQSAEAVNQASAALHQLLFKPLRPKLGNAKDVFLSPDGALNLLPFEVLRDESGRFLIQDFTFNYIAAGRDLLGFGQLKGAPGKNLVMGNPDYNLDGESKQTVVRQLNLQRGTAAPPYVFSRELRNFRFTSLPGTQREVEAIRNLLDENSSEFFVGREALEAVLMSRTAPRILHLATHGFYLGDQPPPPAEFPGNLEIGTPRDDGGGEAAKSVTHEDPLVRSGIALAGANATIASLEKGQDDGVVTAEKILNLNLIGTELVVLSACETGLGDVKSGEGIFGLRRAFSQAGAKSLIISMWSIPDDETKELMALFYTNIQSGTMNRAQALRQAALTEMEAVRQKYGNANPFFWGAFIFSGEQ